MKLYAPVSAIIAAAILAAGATTGAHAGGTTSHRGDLTWGEFNRDLAKGQTEGNLEGHYGCSCKGLTIDQRTDPQGHAHKWVRYHDTRTNSSLVEFRRDSFGYWRVLRAQWETDGEGFYVHIQ